MSQGKKMDFKTFPTPGGFERAQLPLVGIPLSARRKIIKAYQLQARHSNPLNPEGPPDAPSPLDKTNLEEINLEDLLASGDKAAS